MINRPYDLRVYGNPDADKLEKMLDIIMRHVLEEHRRIEGTELRLSDEEFKAFRQHTAEALIGHTKGEVTKELLFSPKFLLNLHEQLKDSALISKIVDIIHKENLNKPDITKEELKLKLGKHLAPKEVARLSTVLDKALKNDKLKNNFKLKPEPPTPGQTKPKLSEEEERQERLIENLYGLRGSMPVVVECFLGNPLIAPPGPTYETALNQISSRLITSDPSSRGDYLGFKNKAADSLESIGIDVKAIVDGIVGELSRPAPRL